MSARVCFLLGRAPGDGSVLPATVERLRRADAEVFVEVCDGSNLPFALLETMDLVVLRALPSASLVAASALAAPCCNSVPSSLAARQKVVGTALLAAAGVAAPATVVRQRWAEVLAEARARPVVVKAAAGSRGEGVRFLPGAPADGPPPWPPPHLVQDRIDHDGVDRKLYVVDDHVTGVLRRWPPHSLADKRGQHFEPGPELADLAHRAGRALGLEVFGVDVVVTPDGTPLVVDVNAFPGFKGVPGADRLLAGHLLRRARDARDARATR